MILDDPSTRAEVDIALGRTAGGAIGIVDLNDAPPSCDSKSPATARSLSSASRTRASTFDVLADREVIDRDLANLAPARDRSEKPDQPWLRVVGPPPGSTRIVAGKPGCTASIPDHGCNGRRSLRDSAGVPNRQSRNQFCQPAILKSCNLRNTSIVSNPCRASIAPSTSA